MPKSHYCIYLAIFRYICGMFEFDKIDWNWIKINEHADTTRLRLSAHGDEKRLFEIAQIDCRQRVREKLSQTLADIPQFIFPSTLSAQQSTSDLLASYHAEFINPGWKVLDMTSGLGIDARHICNKAALVTVCDIDPQIAYCAKFNFQQAGIKNIEVINCDSIKYLSELPSDSFDCIFIDPARRGIHGERLFALSHCEPNVTIILDEMLRVAPNVIIKASPMLDIAHTLSEVNHTKQIIALGTRSECKELVIICQRNFTGKNSIKSVTLSSEKRHIICFPSDHTDINQISSYSDPMVSHILYDPFPVVLKTGGFGFICNKYNVNKIASDSHFFHSNQLNIEFPGTAHEILWIDEMSKRSLKDLPKLFPEMDVTSKNFPMTSAELTSRLKVKPSGSIRLFACKNQTGKKLLIVGKRI